MTGMPVVPRRWPGVAGTCMATGVVAAAVIVRVGADHRVTSYVGVSDLFSVVGLTAAIGLLLAGGSHVLSGLRGPEGTLCLLLAVVWVSPVFVGWEYGALELRAAAAMLPGFAVPLLVHLAVASPRGAPPALRAALVAVYVAVGGMAVAAATVHNPFLDLDSWSNVEDFAFVAADPGVAQRLREWQRVLTVVVAAGVVLVVPARALHGRHLRRARVWIPALVAVAAEAGYAATLLRQPLEQFSSDAGLVLFVIRAAGLTALAAGVALAVDARRRMVRRMAGLVADLAQRPPAGTFEASLRSGLRDPDVEVRYWMRERGEYVDSLGRPRPEEPHDIRARARVVRGEQPVALVTYDAERTGEPGLERQLGAAARLAIDNERLRAESLAHLRELSDSRARIVAASDQQRRLLERDLHDGAQQRLLAVAFELRLARADAAAAGDGALVARLDEAIDSAVAALEELREFAHGVFPAVLDEAGLEQALWSLADRSGVAVDLDCHLGDQTCSAQAERAAYLVARAALDSAVDPAALTVRHERDRLVLIASGVGAVDRTHLADRVGAMGGELHHGDGRLEAVIPCG